MSVQKITVNQIAQKLMLMGKGSYIPLQSKTLQSPGSLKIMFYKKSLNTS